MKLLSIVFILLIWQVSIAQDSSKTYLFVGSCTPMEKNRWNLRLSI